MRKMKYIYLLTQSCLKVVVQLKKKTLLTIFYFFIINIIVFNCIDEMTMYIQKIYCYIFQVYKSFLRAVKSYNEISNEN